MPKKGYRQTPEHRARISAALRGRPHTKARKKAIARGVFRYYERKRTPNRT